MKIAILALLVLAAIASVRANPEVDVFNLDQLIAEVEAQVPALRQSVTETIANMKANAISASSAMADTLGPIADNIVIPVYSRTADIEILAADIRRTAVVDGPTFIANMKASVAGKLAQQTASRQGVVANMQSIVSADSTAAANGLGTTSTIRAQFKADASTNRFLSQNTASTNVNNAIMGEATRQTADVSTMNSQITAATGSLSTAMSSTISTEASRADAACSARISSTGAGFPVQTGTNDYGTCLSTQNGAMYYSSNTKRVFICSGLKWGALNMFPPAFRDSTVLSRPQAAALTQMLNFGSVWTKCYRGSQDSGFGTSSASTNFHNACNSKGPTVVIAKSTAGRIWGGYTDQPWLSRGGWVSSYEAFLWRFNPTNVNAFERASLYYSGGYGNAMYDQVSYCTTFGGGHDWYLDSTCKTGYTSNGSSYYYASGQTPYDQSWFGGSYSSWVLAELEVYYLSA